MSSPPHVGTQGCTPAGGIGRGLTGFKMGPVSLPSLEMSALQFCLGIYEAGI